MPANIVHHQIRLIIIWNIIVRGFNEHVKELHTIACHDYIDWRSAGKSRFRGICLLTN